VGVDSATDYEGLKREFDCGQLDVSALSDRLRDSWAVVYRQHSRECELVEVDQGGLTYLFDISGERVVGVCGSVTPSDAPRPATRMRGHPLPAGRADLVRGHLVAHSLGGGTDINLIPQNARLNISGGWRRFEQLAHASPGSFVAVAAAYDSDSQTPDRLTYLIAIDRELQFETFSNAADDHLR
jgi:hypothetical protein